MHIESVRLVNWGCFKGEHVLDLDAIPYAVVATREGDPERSNWNGKTMLLEAIPFALYGVHRHRLEEGWISKGEVESSVTLMFDGWTVCRFRVPGKGTQLEVRMYNRDLKPEFRGDEFKGDEAQRKIEELVGLGL
jgi:hypothetical protein